MDRVAHNEIRLSSEPGFSSPALQCSLFDVSPVFSWRTILSTNLFNTSPRLSIPTFTADLAFILLTYGFALSNLARSYVTALDTHGRDQVVAESDRKTRDEQLNVAVSFLRRASGIFSYVSENVLATWNVSKPGSASNLKKPPDLTEEMSGALAK